MNETNVLVYKPECD